MAAHKTEDVYSSFHVLTRRKPKVGPLQIHKTCFAIKGIVVVDRPAWGWCGVAGGLLSLLSSLPFPAKSQVAFAEKLQVKDCRSSFG